MLFARLNNVIEGCTSLKAGLADENKAQLDALIAALSPVMSTMENKDAAEVDVTQEVLKLEKSLKDLVASWGPPVAAAAKAEKGLATN